MIIGLTAIFIILCCNKEDAPEPFFTNSVIKGYVRLSFPDYGVIPDSPVNATVIAYGPYGDILTLTDSVGDFEISGLGNGTYEINYSKEGFRTVRQFGIQLFGYDTIEVYSPVLYKN